MLKNKLYALYGDSYTIKLISDTYTIQIRVPQELSDSEIRSTYTMLEVIVPANMIIDIQRDINLKMEARTYNLWMN